VRALAAARMITATPAAKGIPMWRERGLITADLLLRLFVERARQFSRPVVVEHPFLLPADPYQRVFGNYANSYIAKVPGLNGNWVLRPDNLHINAARLREPKEDEPIIATGGLLRTLHGGAAEMFRDRHIWPAIQANQLVDRSDAALALSRWRQAVEETIAGAGLPTVTVEPAAESPYARRCLLVVSCLPDGRPTVLATLYVLSDMYRRRLGVAADLIDVGFTGKIVAVAAMHHRDSRGLALPSALAPLQLGIVTASHRQRVADAWAGKLETSGIRAQILTVHESASPRRRAERRLHREATPLVISASTGMLVRRMPLRRTPMPASCDPVALVATELAAHDRRLAGFSTRRFERGLRHTGLLRHICAGCAATVKPALFGWAEPGDVGACASCGNTGRKALLSETERFY
jgi:hypothetical protein